MPYNINYLLTEPAQAEPGNIGPRSFLFGPRCARSVLSRPRANIPQYGPRARLVRGYSCFVFCFGCNNESDPENSIALHRIPFF